MWGREDCNRRTRGLYVNIQTRPTSLPQLYMNGNRGPLCKEFGILCKITQAEILPKLRLKKVLRRIISVEPDVCFSLQLKQQGMFSKSLHLFGDCEMIRLGAKLFLGPSKMPPVIPLMIVGEKVVKWSGGNEAICLDVKQICKRGNNSEVKHWIFCIKATGSRR